MRIINQTKFSTDDLRVLFSACLREDTRLEQDHIASKNLTIKVYKSKKTIRGKAYVGQYKFVDPKHPNIWVGLPLPSHTTDCRLPLKFDAFSVHNIAFVFLHELQHYRGFQHGKINDKNLMNVAEKFKHFPIKVEQPILKQKEDIRLKRYCHVLNVVKDKEAKLKRLQGQLKKWKQKQKYYERTLKAAGKF